MSGQGGLKMKPTMMAVIIMITAIVLMTAFDINILPNAGTKVSESALPNILFVCPAENSTWKSLSDALIIFKRPLIIGFSFGVLILLSVWAWALYQNLLKDKFIRDAFKTPWGFTKMLFWATVIVVMFMNGPNSFQTVRVTNRPGEWILCERTSNGAIPVHASSIHQG